MQIIVMIIIVTRGIIEIKIEKHFARYNSTSSCFSIVMDLNPTSSDSAIMIILPHPISAIVVDSNPT